MITRYELFNEAEAELDNLGGGGDFTDADSSLNTSQEISMEDQILEAVRSEEGYEDEDARFWGKDSKESDSKEESPKKEGIDHNENNLDAEEMLKKLAEEDKDVEVESDEKSEESEEGEKEVQFHELKHKDEFVKVEKGSEQEKELLQKGLDYTKKTQSLAEERKSFDEEKGVINKLHEERTKALEDSYKNFESMVQENQILEQAIPLLKERYPDSFEELTECYQEASRVQDSPAMRVMRAQVQALQDQIKESNEKFNSITNNAELQTIKTEYAKEVDAVKAEFSPMLKKIGLNVDYDKVTEVWKNGESTNMTYKQALLSLYAEPINKLYASRAKVSEAEKKAAIGKVRGVSSFNRSRGSNTVSTSKTLDDFERNWEKELSGI